MYDFVVDYSLCPKGTKLQLSLTCTFAQTEAKALRSAARDLIDARCIPHQAHLDFKCAPRFAYLWDMNGNAEALCVNGRVSMLGRILCEAFQLRPIYYFYVHGDKRKMYFKEERDEGMDRNSSITSAPSKCKSNSEKKVLVKQQELKR